MLVLARRVGESITIGEDTVVTVVELTGSQVRIGITAPRNVQVLREEIYKTMQEENRAAAQGLQSPSALEEVLAHLWKKKEQV